MCFSAEASLTAAIGVGAIGMISIRQCYYKPFLFFAALPLLFALQQLSEGFIWLHLKHGLFSNDVFISSQVIYLTFAFLIWPFWVPFSLAVVETIIWRKAALFLLFIGGVALSLINLSYGIHQEAAVEVVGRSLHYVGTVPEQVILYSVLVLLPSFISSLKGMIPFGIFAVIGYFTAVYFYTGAFVSVWCFFAALLSIMVYYIVKINQPITQPLSKTI